MDNSLIIIFAVVIIILISFLIFMYFKVKFIPQSKFLELENAYNTNKDEYNKLSYINDELRNAKEKIIDLENEIKESNKLYYIEKSKSEQYQEDKIELENKLLSNEEQIEKFRNEVQKIKNENSELNSENKYFKEKLETQKLEFESMQKQIKIEFENLANKILEEKSEKFTKSNQEQIKRLLEPLDINLKEFKTKVEETYDKESKERFSLEKSIEELVKLNNQISDDAKNLTNALKSDVKKQGNWGEVILETILENSGLIKNQQYFLQHQYIDDEGNKKIPDVTIIFPDNRKVIIDSKVSLVAYNEYVNEVDYDKQIKALEKHISSINSHIKLLSDKNYNESNESLDFTLMFVPIEPAYLVAVQHDNELWNKAYKNKIILISPTNLIATLKLISELWKRDAQTKNTLEIADRGKKLYEKMVGFLESFKDIKVNLEKANDSYNIAFNRLSGGNGNVIWQTQELKKLGIDSKKTLPVEFQVEDNIDNDLLE